MRKSERAIRCFKRLNKLYPNAKTGLNFKNPFQLLVATILSAQTTDIAVNKVTGRLFRNYLGPSALANAREEEVAGIIRSIGLYKTKARNIVNCSKALIENFNSIVPSTMEGLTSLPGVGRKTANCVLGTAFDINLGFVVDTHIRRLAGRLKFTRQEDPLKIEQDLMKLFPQKEWTKMGHLLIIHGRNVCRARKPLCDKCILNDICPSGL